MRLIDGDPLYEEVQHSEELATNRVLDTKSTLPYPNNLNPSYIRYVAQMNERTRFKYMIADAPTIESEYTLIPVTKEQILQAGYEGREVRFHIGGRLFAIRELAQ